MRRFPLLYWVLSLHVVHHDLGRYLDPMAHRSCQRCKETT